MIAVIDYHNGNPGSILNMLKKIRQEAVLTSEAGVIARASKIILPGVGSFDAGMKNLESLGLVDILNECVVKNRIPFLGICLGMQLLSRSSEEGTVAGLGWIDARVVKFHFNQEQLRSKIPHIGWNDIDIKKKDGIFSGFSDESRFYFVHSYHLETEDNSIVAATTDYEYSFVSAIRKDNIHAVQFHPEKSHKFGLQLFQNFAAL